jgi:hypothetical protein
MAETAVTDGDWTLSGINMYSAVSGNVGIGVPSPSQKLDVNGTVKMTGFEMPTGASAGYVLTTNGTGVGTWQPAAGGGEIGGSGTTNYIPKFTSSTTIGNSGIYQSGSNIGIGITSPGSDLHVREAGSYGQITVDGSVRGAVVFGDKDDATDQKYHYIRSDGAKMYMGKVNDAFNVWTNSLNILRSNGYVGIGTTSPSEKLDVVGNIELSGTIKGRVPGVEYANASGLGTQTSISTSWLTLKSVSVTHPGDGFVVCIGTGHVDWDQTDYTGSIHAGWTTSSTGTPVSYNRVSLSVADGTTYIPLTAIHTFTVSGSGTTTFYFRAELSTSGNMDFFEGSVAAMYFPTKY